MYPFSLRNLAQLSLCCFLLLGSAMAEVKQTGKHFLWEVKSGTKAVYLFGSLHAAKPSFYPLPAAVEQAYQQAEVLAVEVDITDLRQISRGMPLMQYRAGDSLARHLKPQTWQRLKAHIETAGGSLEQMAMLKPALLASSLAMGEFVSRGYTPQAGIDLHFLQRAKQDGKAVQELESFAYQAAILGGLTDSEGEAMLQQTLDGIQNGEAVQQLEQMVQAWQAGDVAAMASVLAQSNRDAASARVFKKLFDERNVGMASKIAKLLGSGKKALIVVGAGHMAGQRSVIDLLRRRGLQVTQLP